MRRRSGNARLCVHPSAARIGPSLDSSVRAVGSSSTYDSLFRLSVPLISLIHTPISNSPQAFSCSRCSAVGCIRCGVYNAFVATAPTRLWCSGRRGTATPASPAQTSEYPCEYPCEYSSSTESTPRRPRPHPRRPVRAEGPRGYRVPSRVPLLAPSLILTPPRTLRSTL